MELKMVKKCLRPCEIFPPGDNPQHIYRPWITLKDGRRIYAKNYGLTAFKILKRY